MSSDDRRARERAPDGDSAPFVHERIDERRRWLLFWLMCSERCVVVFETKKVLSKSDLHRLILLVRYVEALFLHVIMTSWIRNEAVSPSFLKSSRAGVIWGIMGVGLREASCILRTDRCCCITPCPCPSAPAALSLPGRAAPNSSVDWSMVSTDSRSCICIWQLPLCSTQKRAKLVCYNYKYKS